jgi:predicted TIM-barrel fold metal-dependent hydrolase
MAGIIDFHTHAFPDSIAEKAMAALKQEGDIKAHLDGRIASLISSMDKNGIEKSLVCSIATKPSQFEPILSWSKKISSERIVPFPSLHPDDPEAAERIDRIKEQGLKGIKFHPYYQNFSIDEDRLFPLYDRISRNGLILVMHTGFDFAYEKNRITDPEKILKVLENFPDLKLVTTHLGAWDDWDEVEKLLIGKEIYMEISFSLEFLNKERAYSIICRHPKEYILFGTDSPWTDQGKTLSLFKELNLEKDVEEHILRHNAIRLLNSV